MTAAPAPTEAITAPEVDETAGAGAAVTGQGHQPASTVDKVLLHEHPAASISAAEDEARQVAEAGAPLCDPLEGVSIIGKRLVETFPADLRHLVPEKARDARWRQPTLGAFFDLTNAEAEPMRLVAQMIRNPDGARVFTQEELEGLEGEEGIVLLTLADNMENEVVLAAKRMQERSAVFNESIHRREVRDTIPTEYYNLLPEHIQAATWHRPKAKGYISRMSDAKVRVTENMVTMLRDDEGHNVTTQQELENLPMVAGMILVAIARKLETELKEVADRVRAEVANDRGKKSLFEI